MTGKNHQNRTWRNAGFNPLFLKAPSFSPERNGGFRSLPLDKPHSLRLGVTGFTMVEILVVLAITGLITAGMVNFMISQSQSYSLQEDIQEMEQNARVAIEILTSELKKSTSPVKPDSSNNDNNITITTANGVTAYSLRNEQPKDKDTVVDGNSSRIGYGTNSSIAYFITQDMNGDGNRDIPIFQYDDRNNPTEVTVTIVARTRHKDPQYTKNRGYRQIVLRRRIVLRDKT